jgi:hypothetical protein
MRPFTQNFNDPQQNILRFNLSTSFSSFPHDFIQVKNNNFYLRMFHFGSLIPLKLQVNSLFARDASDASNLFIIYAFTCWWRVFNFIRIFDVRINILNKPFERPAA